MSSRAIGDALTQAEVIRFRTAGLSWARIADEFCYRSRSGAEHAVRAGLEASCLVVGLRVVMHARMERLECRLRALDSSVACETLAHVERMRLLLHDAPGAGPLRACVADVAGLVARRNPHLPAVDLRALDRRLRARRRGATLDEMRGGYANRSGVQKALDRDVRRMLLEVAAAYFDDELLGVRYSWREIDLAVRRRPVDVERLQAALDLLDEVLARMHLFDVLLTYGQLAGRRRPSVREP